ncbi:structural protein [Cellulophaga phage phi48:2]|uniref:structural protein n=1 Tax=Cellulophaga phage phi48:2 TaxID=1327968 RepID=UPI000351C30D|nr:structural protein [Cellulophaga phage phi48:2]AGO47259.1 structural protein [Cellulophaga phage phi48:2]
MTLFGAIEKLIRHFGLLEGGELNQLRTDREAYEIEAQKEDASKDKKLYAKMHKGIYIRMFMPFFYFYLMSIVRNIISPPENDDDFLRD